MSDTKEAKNTPRAQACYTCGQDHDWCWSEAFDKFGFEDGDGDVMTYAVADALRAKGYEVETAWWGSHNELIVAIKSNGASMIPESAKIGYDDPLDYLPQEIIDILDAAFSEAQQA